MGCSCFFFFQAEDGIRDLVRSRGLGDVYKRQASILGLPGPPLVGAFGVLALVACWVKLAGIAIALSLIHI